MALLAAATFSGLPDLGFDTHDDEFILDSAHLLNSLSPALFLQNTSIQGRPSFNLYIWVAFQLCGQNPAGYHILQAGLHLIASLLLALSFRRLGGRFDLGLIAGLLFLVNVAHFRTVHWISATGYILALIFGLLILLINDRILKTGRWNWSLGGVGAVVAAIFAHPSMDTVGKIDQAAGARAANGPTRVFASGICSTQAT